MKTSFDEPLESAAKKTYVLHNVVAVQASLRSLQKNIQILLLKS